MVTMIKIADDVREVLTRSATTSKVLTLPAGTNIKTILITIQKGD